MDEGAGQRADQGGLVVDLDEAECWALAATRPVGRIAWCGSAGPTVVPVNFVVEDRTVHVRTSAYSALARECDDSPVAFEVDALDDESRSGWSVLIRGRAHVDFAREQNPGPDPWPAGSKALHLRIAVEKVTGRSLSR